MKYMSSTYICGFELLLFVIKTALNDRCTRQQTLLKRSKCLVLDLNGGFLLEH